MGNHLRGYAMTRTGRTPSQPVAGLRLEAALAKGTLAPGGAFRPRYLLHEYPHQAVRVVRRIDPGLRVVQASIKPGACARRGARWTARPGQDGLPPGPLFV
jgi:hypothetical protein